MAGKQQQSETTKSTPASDPASFFRFPHIFWVVAISFGLYLLTMAAFVPESIPCCYLGYIGHFGKYVGRNFPIFTKGLFVVAISLHVIEALYTTKLCRDKNLNSETTLKWTLQTLLFGFASIVRLWAYNPSKKS